MKLTRTPRLHEYQVEEGAAQQPQNESGQPQHHLEPRPAVVGLAPGPTLRPSSPLLYPQREGVGGLRQRRLLDRHFGQRVLLDADHRRLLGRVAVGQHLVFGQAAVGRVGRGGCFQDLRRHQGAVGVGGMASAPAKKEDTLRVFAIHF